MDSSETHPAELVSRAAYSIGDFCAAHGFTKPTLYKIMRAGDGLRIMRVGRRVPISHEAAADWRNEIEMKSQCLSVE